MFQEGDVYYWKYSKYYKGIYLKSSEKWFKEHLGFLKNAWGMDTVRIIGKDLLFNGLTYDEFHNSNDYEIEFKGNLIQTDQAYYLIEISELEKNFYHEHDITIIPHTNSDIKCSSGKKCYGAMPQHYNVYYKKQNAKRDTDKMFKFFMNKKEALTTEMNKANEILTSISLGKLEDINLNQTVD